MVNSTLVATPTLYVNPAIGNDANTGTWLNPYKTLSRALNGSTTPKIIQLAPGTYTTASGEVFPLVISASVIVVGHEATKGQGIVISGSGEYKSESFGVQKITLLLLDDAQLLGVTVINPMEKGTGVWIESTAQQFEEPASPTLANNTFIKCGREGVFVSGSAKPLIQDNVFVQNGIGGLVMARNSKGKVLRNVLQKNVLGIGISDFAAPLVANNTVSENRHAIALSRTARPVVRHNLIENNIQNGLLVNGNAAPDLGSTQDPAGNIFRNNGQFDVQNTTSVQLISVGNQLNSAQIKGLVKLLTATNDTAQSVAVSTISDTEVAEHWAEPFIQALISMGLTHGFADGTFEPDKPITRAQYAALVAACFNPIPKYPAPDFTDVPKDFWAYDAIQIAARGGFVGGFSDRTFRSEQNVLRLQVIVSLVNGLALKPADNTLVSYSDRNTIPEYARTAVATATQNKIIVNYPDPKQLQPNRQATQAEAAAMVYQALVAIGRISIDSALAPNINSPYIVSSSTA